MIGNISMSTQQPSAISNTMRGASRLLAVIGIGIALRAQTNTYPWPSTGNVGIGTTNPNAALQVTGTAVVNGGVWVQGVPSNLVNGAPWYGLGAANFFLGSGANVTQLAGWGGLNLQTAAGQMVMTNGGSVGIGTTNPCATYAPTNCKLSVAGAIQAQEIVVNTGWSDYVFDPGYALRPLSEVKAFIKENHHLPDIPSEAEVKEKGISLGEMQSKLLAKVEELTLHMIDADERNQTLEQQNTELQRRIARLEAGATGAQRGK